MSVDRQRRRVKVVTHIRGDRWMVEGPEVPRTIISLKEHRMANEPALILGAVNAAIALAVGFGLPLTSAQVGLINAAVAAILAVILRSQVSPAK